MEEATFALVSVAWNQYGWKKVDSESKANFGYVKKGGIPHEHLNFKFDRYSGDYVYGYTPGFKQKRRLRNDGSAIVFFISKNYEKNQRKIVGIYGEMELDEKTDENQPEYKTIGGLFTNMRAKKEYSILFPKYLDAYNYEETKRMQQTTIMYIKKNLAREIIYDAIRACSDNNDKTKLYSILGLVLGNAHSDEKNRILAEKKISKMSIPNLRNVLLKETKQKNVTRMITVPERDFEMTEAIKRDRDYKCQVCQSSILQKDQHPYVEAAHITPKAKGGKETPNNIMILCPNHHEEFDRGDSHIMSRDDDEIIVKVNGKVWPIIDLSIRNQ